MRGRSFSDVGTSCNLDMIWRDLRQGSLRILCLGCQRATFSFVDLHAPASAFYSYRRILVRYCRMFLEARNPAPGSFE